MSITPEKLTPGGTLRLIELLKEHMEASRNVLIAKGVLFGYETQRDTIQEALTDLGLFAATQPVVATVQHEAALTTNAEGGLTLTGTVTDWSKLEEIPVLTVKLEEYGDPLRSEASNPYTIVEQEPEKATPAATAKQPCPGLPGAGPCPGFFGKNSKHGLCLSCTLRKVKGGPREPVVEPEEKPRIISVPVQGDGDDGSDMIELPPLPSSIPSVLMVKRRDEFMYARSRAFQDGDVQRAGVFTLYWAWEPLTNGGPSAGTWQMDHAPEAKDKSLPEVIEVATLKGRDWVTGPDDTAIGRSVPADPLDERYPGVTTGGKI